MSKYFVHIVLTNESDTKHPGIVFSEWIEDIEDYLLRDDGTPDFGAIYRIAQREYGRCQSSVYVNTDDSVKRVGWFFVSRQEYDNSNDTYLQGAWVTVIEEVEPAKPAVYESVGI